MSVEQSEIKPEDTSEINQSEAGPDTVSDQNNIDQLFKDPGDIDFLESLKIEPSGRDFSKESLYVKFDPLLQSLKNKTPPKSPAIEVLDKLISLTPSPKQPVNIVTPIQKEMSQDKQIKKETDSNLTKLANLDGTDLERELAKLHELLLKQEKISQEKMNDYESKLVKLTGQTCVLEDKLKEAEEREKSLAKKVNEQTQSNIQFNIVMQEYERLISKLTAEIENDKKSNSQQIASLTNDKETALTHLNNVEAAFSDVHEKYERSKKVIEDYKKNELKMKSIINEQIESIKTKDKQIDLLQSNCSTQVETFNKDLEHLKLLHDQELTRLRAQLRKTELKVISLQESLEQKIKENHELTTICDDLIEGKVPGQH